MRTTMVITNIGFIVEFKLKSYFQELKNNKNIFDGGTQ